MSMRISYLGEVKKKSNNVNVNKSKTLANNYNYNNNNNNGIYLKQIPRRSKSPFRKYEVAVTGSNNNDNNSNNASKSNSISNIALNMITDHNHSHPDMKLINNFQDLVIACVDNHSRENNTSLICFKQQKYTLNSLSNSDDQSSEEEKKKKTNNIICTRCGQLENDLKLVNLATQNMESLKREDDLLRKKVFEGDTDPVTFRRLEYIVELIKKLKQIDNNNNNNNTNTKLTCLIANNKYQQTINKQNGKIQILKQKRQMYKQQSHQMKCVKSLSDSAFHSELKLHPIIKKNSIYLN